MAVLISGTETSAASETSGSRETSLSLGALTLVSVGQDTVGT